MTEAELLEALDAHDSLVVRCAGGEISWREFARLYDTFFMSWALDGHESSPEDRKLLARYDSRIALHARIWHEIECRVIDDDLAAQPSAAAAGFFGTEVASAKLRQIARDAGML